MPTRTGVYSRVAASVWHSAAGALVNPPRVFVVVVTCRETQPKAYLLKIIYAGDPLFFAFGTTHGRQQHPSENCNNRNDDDEMP